MTHHTLFALKELWLVLKFNTISASISSQSLIQVSTRQLAVSSLSKGISSKFNFHKSIGTDGTQTRKFLAP